MPSPSATPDPASRRPGSRWQVRLLGAFEMRSGDRVTRRFGEKVMLPLLARLLLEPRVVHPRLTLARALWPERDDDPAWQLRNLSKRLSDLRNVYLEPPGFPAVRTLVDDDDTLRLNAEAFDTDVDRFERLVRQKRWREARDAYGGELLPGVDDALVERRRHELAMLLAHVDEQLGRPDAGFAADDGDDEAEAAPAAQRRGIVPYESDFFGRDDEIRRLGEQVASHRLVVVHGPPGAGKSRTASEAGRTQFDGFEPRLAASVADAANADDVIDAVRRAAGVEIGSGPKGALEAIATRLRSERALILLDDFESVACTDGEGALAQLLDALPLAHIVVTTRRALARPDVVQVDLGPLPLPGEGADLPEAIANPAVALFANRAHAVRTGFHVHARNVGLVVEICRHLDGLPLSLQLAGAQMHRLTLIDLRDRLLASSRLRARNARDDDRHGSLETALDTSWRLLQEPQRQLMGALAVFRGGFTVAQATAVARMPGVGAMLAALARDALLVPWPAGDGATRLGLLTAVREFAEREQGGAAAAAWRAHHREIFERLAIERLRQRDWPLASDRPNLAVAMAHALADDEPAAAARVALALSRLWRARGADANELALLARCAGSDALRPRVRALLHALLTVLLVNAGRGAEAQDHARDALALAGRDPVAGAEALLAQMLLAFLSEQDGGRTVELARRLDATLPAAAPPDLRARAWFWLGAVALQVEGDLPRARRLAERADRLYGRRRDRRGMLQLETLRTMILFGEERYDLMLRRCDEAIEAGTAIGFTVLVLAILNRKAHLLEHLKRPADGLQVMQQQARLAWSAGSSYHLAFAVWNQGLPLAALGRREDATVLMGFAYAYWKRQRGGFSKHDLAYVRELRTIVTQADGPAAWKRWWTRGRAMSDREGLLRACGRGAQR